MSENKRFAQKATPHQIGALVALMAVAIWGVAVLWLHAVTPAGAHVDEIVPIATLTLLCVGLIPFYCVRARWSYVAGVLPPLGLYAMAAIQAQEGILFFSASLYNIITGLVYFIAAALVYLSLRSYRERPGSPWWIAGTILVTGVVYALLSANKEATYRAMATWTQGRIARKLESMETLDEKLAYLADQGDIPSLAVGIVVDDELVWSGTYGEQPADQAIYNVGSITKPFVAAAVLQLYERGLIGLDDDVNEYLPFDVRHPDYPDQAITIRMLLTHQSGLAHSREQYFSFIADRDLLDWEAKRRGRSIYGEITPYDPGLPYKEFMEGYLTPGGPYYSPAVWSARPGMGYNYSTPGYDLLGYLVEQVTGQPFSDYLEENVFGPLGMPDTGLRPAEGLDRQAIPYDQVYGVLAKTNVRFPFYGRKRIGGGGLYSTVPDMARFTIAHLNRGQVDGYQLLQPETVAAMHRQRVDAAVDVGMAGYGFGLNTMRTAPWEFFGHTYDFYGAKGHGGADYGYTSRWFFVEKGEGGYGVILLSNVSRFFKSEYTWFFGVYLKIDNLLMQEAEARFLQQAD
jgi:CubicO group peptidase (beta-lactamase class C family)